MSRSEFYHSKLWQRVRLSIILKQGGICNRCGKPTLSKGKKTQGLIVHHKIYLTDTNYTNEDISINEDNLEAICIDCHNKEHMIKNNTIREDIMFDEEGNVVPSK